MHETQAGASLGQLESAKKTYIGVTWWVLILASPDPLFKPRSVSQRPHSGPSAGPGKVIGMTDEPAGTTGGPGGGSAKQPPRPAPPPGSPRAKKPAKPGSGQHRRKAVAPPGPEQIAAAKAAAAAKRKADAEAAAERARLAAERRRRQRRNSIITWVSVGLVVAVLGGLVVYKVLQKPPSDPVTGSGLSAANPAVVAQVTGVSTKVFDAVGDGGIAVPFLLPAGNPATLTQNGLPRVLYVGSRYCPFCATERWPLVASLARFGTFSGLQFLISAFTGETYKDLHTFDLGSGVTYTSTSVALSAYETEDRKHNTIASLNTADATIFGTYDATPTLPQGSTAGTIPFIDIANRWVISGASYQASDLVGLTWQQIAAAAAAGSAGLGQHIDGTANWFTAALCTLTGNTPASVCSDPMIKGLQARLPVQ
jgi:hypothetical protein